MRDLALHLTSLAKTVPGGRRLFYGLALALEAGERVAIRGESGAGKSTLLNIIAGLDTADLGEVMVAGTDLTRLGEAERTALRRDAIGFVFQAFHILPHLDLARNVAFPLILQKQPRTSALERAGETLHAVGLGDRRSSYPRELSGGELQRVAIARALVHAPRLSSSSRSQLPERTSRLERSIEQRQRRGRALSGMGGHGRKRNDRFRGGNRGKLPLAV